MKNEAIKEPAIHVSQEIRHRPWSVFRVQFHDYSPQLGLEHNGGWQLLQFD